MLKIVIKYLSAGGILFATLLAACSPVSAKKTTPKTLAVPVLSGGTGFGLSGETPSGLYRGGLLVWSPEVKAEQIDKLLRANRETNEKYVALNRYFVSFQEKEIAPLRRALNDQRGQYVRLKAESDERSATLQNQRAAVWFSQEMSALAEKFPAFDVSRSETIFQAYCEAKVIDLATRAFLPETKFRSRPTPSAICESYYQGRFFAGDSCADSPSGRSYYDCVWNEGVVKTQLASRMQLKVSSTATGTKTSRTLSLTEFANLVDVKNALALKDVQYCTASLMRSKILSGAKYRILAGGSITGGFVCGENARFEVSYGAGGWDKELSNASTGYLIDAVEIQQSASTLPASFQWLTPDIAAANPELASAVLARVRQISSFNSRVMGCTSEFNSPNDIFFNDGRLADGISLQGQCKGLLPSLSSIPNVVVLDEQLEALRVELAHRERVLVDLKGQACPVAPSCDVAPAGHARCDFLKAQVRKAAAAEAPGLASILVTDFAMSFERISPSASTVIVWMNNAPVGVGCVGEAKVGACSGTNLTQSLSSAAPLQAEVSQSGELVLKMKVDSRQLSAAGVPESVVRQFELFNDQVLELNASMNSFESLVPYLSGKAFIRSDFSSVQALAEGSVSYLIENSFDRRLGEFCSAN